MQDFNLEDWDVPDRLSFSQELYTLRLVNKTSWLQLANKRLDYVELTKLLGYI